MVTQVLRGIFPNSMDFVGLTRADQHNTPMTFDQFVDQAWADHADKSVDVADRLKDFLPNVSHQDQIPGLVSLITHVYGEHLGQWAEGIELLQRLQLQADSAENRNTIFRSVSALRLAGGLADNVDDLMNSDQIRVLCVASAALIGQKQFPRAVAYFNDALQLAAEGLGANDPAHRSLAVTANNLATNLEKQTSRSPEETTLMVRMARVALEHWLLAGQWTQHQAAHYRLSKALFLAGNLVEALEEAMSCLAICKSHKAGPLEMFWANEAVASVIHDSKPSAFVDYLRNMRDAFENVDEADKPDCEPRLAELEASIV